MNLILASTFTWKDATSACFQLPYTYVKLGQNCLDWTSCFKSKKSFLFFFSRLEKNYVAQLKALSGENEDQRSQIAQMEKEMNNLCTELEAQKEANVRSPSNTMKNLMERLKAQLTQREKQLKVFQIFSFLCFCFIWLFEGINMKCLGKLILELRAICFYSVFLFSLRISVSQSKDVNLSYSARLFFLLSVWLTGSYTGVYWELNNYC